jgi:hypothetical protein
MTKDKIFRFSKYNVRIYNFLYKFAAHLKPCGGTPETLRRHSGCGTLPQAQIELQQITEKEEARSSLQKNWICDIKY